MNTDNLTGAQGDVVAIELWGGRMLSWHRSTGAVGIDGVEVQENDAAILVSLLEEPGELVSSGALLERHYPGSSGHNLMAWRVRRLRRRLGDAVVDTVTDLGYRLCVADAEAHGPTYNMLAGPVRYYPRRRRLKGPRGPEVELTPREHRLALFLFGRVGRSATKADVTKACGITKPMRLQETSEGLLAKFKKVGAAKLLVAGGDTWCLLVDEMEGGIVRVHPLELEPATKTVRMYGLPVDLQTGWFAMLELLARRPTIGVSRWDLAVARAAEDAAGDVPGTPDSATTEVRDPYLSLLTDELDSILDDVDTEVARIQHALGPDGGRLIQGYGEGYYLDIREFGLRAVGSLQLDEAVRKARNGPRSQALSLRDVALLKELLLADDSIVAREDLVALAGLETWQPLYDALRPLREKLCRLTEPEASEVIVYDEGTDAYRLATELFGVLDTEADARQRPNRTLRPRAQSS